MIDRFRLEKVDRNRKGARGCKTRRSSLADLTMDATTRFTVTSVRKSVHYTDVCLSTIQALVGDAQHDFSALVWRPSENLVGFSHLFQREDGAGVGRQLGGVE